MRGGKSAQHQRGDPPPGPAAGGRGRMAAARVDVQAFAVLYERYRDDLLRYTFYCLGEWDEAADATQQVFANAMAGLPRCRSRRYVPAWLFRIAHNEVSTRLSRRSRRPQSPLPDAAEIVDPARRRRTWPIAADDHERLRARTSRSAARLRAALRRAERQGDRPHPRQERGAVRTAQSRAVAGAR